MIFAAAYSLVLTAGCVKYLRQPLAARYRERVIGKTNPVLPAMVMILIKCAAPVPHRSDVCVRINPLQILP